MQESTPSPEARQPLAVHWIFFAIFIIAGLLLRWLELDTRPIHHDESLHGMYGIYAYDWPKEKYYRYDPMLHGPLLYNLYPFVYYTLGISDWSMRALIAVLGTLLMFVPFLFRRYLNPVSLIAITAAVALSPGLVYWSRFVHHDLLVLLGWFLMLYGVARAAGKHKALYVLCGIAVQFIVKANVFITLALIAAYFIYEKILFILYPDGNLRSPRKHDLLNLGRLFFFPSLLALVLAVISTISLGLLFKNHDPLKVFAASFVVIEAILLLLWPASAAGATCSSSAVSWMLEHKSALIFAAAAALFIFFFYYTAGFKYPYAFFACTAEAAIPDKCNGVHRIWEMLTYWIHQDRIERIVGPFAFHFYVLSWYELPFICAMFLAAWLMYRESTPLLRALGAFGLGLGSVLALVFVDQDVPQYYIWKFFKLKDSLDILMLFLLFTQSLTVTTHHLLRKERGLSFFAYFFYATFFCYSYAGEKTPWLAIYPLVTGLAYLTLFFQDYFERKPLNDWEHFPIGKVIQHLGMIVLILGIIFLMEQQSAAYWNWLVAGTALTCAVVLISNIPPLKSLFSIYSLRWTLLFALFGLLLWQVAPFNLWTLIITGILLTGFAFIDSVIESRMDKVLSEYPGTSILLLFATISLVCLIHSTINPAQVYSSFMQLLLQNWRWLTAGMVLLGLGLMTRALQILEGCNLRNLVFVCCVLFTLRASILTNFVFAGHANELMSQVHTTPEYDGIMKRIRQEYLAMSEEKRPEMLVYDNCTAVWPSVWYMRRLPLRFQSRKEDLGKYLYIMQDWDDKNKEVPAGFEARKVKLRGWWVPDYKKMSLQRFLNYSLNHIPWTPSHGGDPSGYSYVTLFSRTAK